LVLALSCEGATGCSSDQISPLTSALGQKKKVSKTDDGGDPSQDETHYTKEIDNSGANFQVKDVLLLKSSLDSCVGPGMTTVKAEMLLPTDLNAQVAALPDGKIRFLLPTQYQDGQNIVDRESGNLVDEANGTRTSTTADSLTDTYLRSLETIANVVAHNCSLANPNCKCATKDDARAMLERCLPGLDPETKEMDEAAEMLGLVCADGAPGMRKAIASMISSYAFAQAR